MTERIIRRQEMLREVHAHAVLKVSDHVVRYHAAWEEDGHMFIQVCFIAIQWPKHFFVKSSYCASP
jgi:hypothetical protein